MALSLCRLAVGLLQYDVDALVLGLFDHRGSKRTLLGGNLMIL
jgi:hypothetical protein